MGLLTSCLGDSHETAPVSCYPGRSGLSSEAAASESRLLLCVTPRHVLAHQGRHGRCHFLGLWGGVFSWANSCLLMSPQEKLPNKPSNQYSHLPNLRVRVW